MAAELKEEMDMESDLIKKGGGIFEVYLDDDLIFSKQELGRFPNDGEVLALLKEKQA